MGYPAKRAKILEERYAIWYYINMNSFIQADIFFFITSIAVVLISILLIVIFYYAIKILRDIKHISYLAREESDIISEELSNLRVNIKREGAKIKHLANFFTKVHKKSKKVAK